MASDPTGLGHTLLAALDLHLSPHQQHQGEGAAGDGSISFEDLTKALGSLPRSKALGLTGCPMSSISAFGNSWGQNSPLYSRKPFSQTAQDSSPRT